MRSNFLAGFEKTAFVGTLARGAYRGVARLAGGNLSKPLGVFDHLSVPFTAMQAKGEASGTYSKLQAARQRKGMTL